MPARMSVQMPVHMPGHMPVRTSAHTSAHISVRTAAFSRTFVFCTQAFEILSDLAKTSADVAKQIITAVADLTERCVPRCDGGLRTGTCCVWGQRRRRRVHGPAVPTCLRQDRATTTFFLVPSGSRGPMRRLRPGGLRRGAAPSGREETSPRRRRRPRRSVHARAANTH